MIIVAARRTSFLDVNGIIGEANWRINYNFCRWQKFFFSRLAFKAWTCYAKHCENKGLTHCSSRWFSEGWVKVLHLKQERVFFGWLLSQSLTPIQWICFFNAALKRLIILYFAHDVTAMVSVSDFLKKIKCEIIFKTLMRGYIAINNLRRARRHFIKMQRAWILFYDTNFP